MVFIFLDWKYKQAEVKFSCLVSKNRQYSSIHFISSFKGMSLYTGVWSIGHICFLLNNGSSVPYHQEKMVSLFFEFTWHFWSWVSTTSVRTVCWSTENLGDSFDMIWERWEGGRGAGSASWSLSLDHWSPRTAPDGCCVGGEQVTSQGCGTGEAKVLPVLGDQMAVGRGRD